MPWCVRMNRTWRAPSGSIITSWARSSSPWVTPVADAWAKAAARAAVTTDAAVVPVAATAWSVSAAGPAKAVPASPVAAVVTATATARLRMWGLRMDEGSSFRGGRDHQPP
jgi:hypothetical protein